MSPAGRIASGLHRACGCAALLAMGSCAPDSDRPVVYAAASIAGAVQEVVGERFVVNAAASSTLAQQIASGADAALFISAHRRWMDQLEQAGLLVPGTRRGLVANELVWIATADSTLELDFGADPGEQFTGRLAIGDPTHVPVGEYARAALQALGFWESLQARLAPAVDARAAVSYVESGAAQLGIAYRTDAAGNPRVRVVAPMPEAAAPPVRYEVALVTDRPEGRQLLEEMTGARARSVFAGRGFTAVVAAEPPQAPATSPAAGWLTAAELSALGLSLLVGVVATLLALVPAVALALWMARGSSTLRSVTQAVVATPLVLPPVVVGYFLLLLFSPGPLPFTWVAAALAATVMGFPLMVRALRQAFEGVDRNLEEAAATLGASPLRVFWSVTLPMSRGGLVAGASLCFARSVGEFGATVTFAGNVLGETRTLPLAIWTALQTPEGQPMAWRLTWICVALAVVATLLSELLLRRARWRT